MQTIITLTTDFGYQDHYAAVLKGVILSINPAALVVDITHSISPHSIMHGALLLAAAYSFFPPRTIHLAVVDPGVGTPRRPIVVVGDTQTFVGPDNGLFTCIYNALKEITVYELTETRFFLPSLSATFHGRDLFAPAAAHLSCGVLPTQMGRRITDYCTLSVPAPHSERGSLCGIVLYADGFSNLITNISQSRLETLGSFQRLKVRIKETTILGVSPCYQAVGRGEPLALIGSLNLLEIAIREGKAEQVLNAHEGDDVTVELQ